MKGAIPQRVRIPPGNCRPRRRTIRGRVVEAALAHVVGNKVEAAYARSDLFERRRRLMNDWGAYLDGERRAGRLAAAL